jgi:hypothetical protein
MPGSARRRRRLALAGLIGTLLAVAAPAAWGADGLGRLWPGSDAPADGGADPALHRGLVNAAKLACAALGCGLLLWGAALTRVGRPGAHRRLRDGLLLGLGTVSLLGWWNFSHFHYPGYIHTHDVFNYYVGSKYFPELGYTRLYECIALADLESGLRTRVAQREITDLETYQLVDTSRILAEPERCTQHFSPWRWSLFKQDLRWFRSRMPAAAWENLQRDHGYNATPTWGILGTLLAGAGRASDAQILALTLLDPLLVLVMWGCTWWAFGWRATCVALLYWGTNHPAEFGWTGGAFLRDGWLAASVIGLCLVRRGRMLPAGFLLGFAALLRVFPILVLGAIGAAALLAMLRRRRLRLQPEHRRLALGALLAVASLVPVSAWVAGDAGAWPDFAHNTRLHLSIPANNAIGLKTALSYHPAARFEKLAAREADPGSAWKQARLATFEARRLLFYALVLAYGALLLWALDGQEDWVAGVLGIGALPILLEPACYYTSALLAFGLLWTRRETVGAALCGLSVLLWAIAAAWVEWDDVFTGSSVAVVAFVVWATATMRPLARPATG